MNSIGDMLRSLSQSFIKAMLVISLTHARYSAATPTQVQSVETPQAQSFSSLYVPDSIPVLGMGFNAISEVFVEKCINGSIVDDATGSEFVNSAGITMTREDVEQSFGFSASARVNISAFSASGSVKIAQQFTESSTSLAFLSSTRIFVGTQRLDSSKPYQVIVKGPAMIEKRCGNYYVDSLQKGADMYMSVKIQLASKEQKERLVAELQASYASFGSMSAVLDKASKMANISGNVQVRSVQRGGAVAIAGSFLSGGASIDCSFANLDACNILLNDALRYASNEFPKNVNFQNAAVLSFTVKPYSFIKGALIPAAVPLQVKSARNSLSKYVTQQRFLKNAIIDALANDDAKIEFVNTSGCAKPVFSNERQPYLALAESMLSKKLSVVNDNIEALRNAVATCYDGLGVRPTAIAIEKCLGATSSIENPTDKDVVHFKSVSLEPDKTLCNGNPPGFTCVGPDSSGFDMFHPCNQGNQCKSKLCEKHPLPIGAALMCIGLGENMPCTVNDQCLSQRCYSCRCAKPTCSPRCGPDSPCGLNSDCASGKCAFYNYRCVE